MAFLITAFEVLIPSPSSSFLRYCFVDYRVASRTVVPQHLALMGIEKVKLELCQTRLSPEASHHLGPWSQTEMRERVLCLLCEIVALSSFKALLMACFRCFFQNGLIYLKLFVDIKKECREQAKSN